MAIIVNCNRTNSHMIGVLDPKVNSQALHAHNLSLYPRVSRNRAALMNCTLSEANFADAAAKPALINLPAANRYLRPIRKWQHENYRLCNVLRHLKRLKARVLNLVPENADGICAL